MFPKLYFSFLASETQSCDQELEKEKEKKRQSNSSSCNIGGFTMERSLLQSLSLLSHPFHRDAINLSSNGLAVISFLSFCARPLKMEGNCLAMRRKDRQAVLKDLTSSRKFSVSCVPTFQTHSSCWKKDTEDTRPTW